MALVVDYINGANSIDRLRVSGTTATAQNIFDNHRGIIRHIILTGQAAGNKLVLEDDAGVLLDIETGTTETEGVLLNLNIKFNNLVCSDLDAGLLFIYLDDITEIDSIRAGYVEEGQ